MKLYDFLQLTQMDNLDVVVYQNGKKFTVYEMVLNSDSEIKKISYEDNKIIIEVL